VDLCCIVGSCYIVEMVEYNYVDHHQVDFHHNFVQHLENWLVGFDYQH